MYFDPLSLSLQGISKSNVRRLSQKYQFCNYEKGRVKKRKRKKKRFRRGLVAELEMKKNKRDLLSSVR